MKYFLYLLTGLVLLSTRFPANAQHRLVFSTRSPNSLVQFEFQSGSTEPLVQGGLNEVLGVTVDTVHRKLYWTNNPATGPALIEQSDLNGSNRVTLPIPNLVNLTDIAIDYTTSKLLWVDYGAQKIMRANLDGSNVETLHNAQKPVGLTINCTYNKIYWTEQRSGNNGGKILRMELDGSSPEELITYDGKPVKIAVDCIENKVVWTDDSKKQVWVSDPGGLKPEILFVLSGNQHPYGIVIDQNAGVIYWTDYLNDVVKSFTLQTGIFAEVLTETNPYALTRYVYSPLATDEPGNNPFGAQLTPNPAAQTLHVVLNSAATAMLYGADGRQRGGFRLDTGANDLPLTALPAGIYLLELVDGDRVDTRRFIKL